MGPLTEQPDWCRIHGDVPVATGGQFLPLAGPGTAPRARLWSLPPQWMTLNIRWRQVQQVPPWWLPRGWGRTA